MGPRPARERRPRPFYDAFAWAYDLLVADPVEPWVAAVEAALPASPARILDAGCGTGRHAAALAARGHAVTLVDAAPALLEQARRRLPAAPAVCADLAGLDLGERFDAVACRGVLNDVVADAERDAVLASLGRHTRSGGVVVLDVRDLEGTRRRYGEPTTTTRTAGDLVFTAHGRMEGDLLVVDERHERRGEQAVEHELVMRPWTADELRERLARAGFDAARVGAGAGRPTGDRLLCTAARR